MSEETDEKKYGILVLTVLIMCLILTQAQKEFNAQTLAMKENISQVLSINYAQADEETSTDPVLDEASEGAESEIQIAMIDKGKIDPFDEFKVNVTKYDETLAFAEEMNQENLEKNEKAEAPPEMMEEGEPKIVEAKIAKDGSVNMEVVSIEELEARESAELSSINESESKQNEEIVMSEDIVPVEEVSAVEEIAVVEETPIAESTEEKAETVEYASTTTPTKIMNIDELLKLKIDAPDSPLPSSTCKMEEFGVEYNCNLNWKVQVDKMGRKRLLVLEDPMVTLNFNIIDMHVKFLDQISRITLEKFGFYQEGFRTEKVNFAGQKAILVKGFDQENEQAQRRDYFYIHEGQLVWVNFSLEPKDRWNDGKGVIQEIKESFVALAK